MKKIAYILCGLALAVSCNLDKFPSDAISAESMSNPENSTVVTDGTYAMFKSILMYDGMVYSANSYVRHYFQMAEFRGDNIALCAYTTDPLNSAIIYKDVSTEGNTGYFWWIAYKILFSTNAMIDAIKEGNPETDHILGENYFLRGVATLHLLQLYSMPYSHGRDNPGVVLRTTTDNSVTVRATVGDCYDSVEADFKKAAQLMKGGKRRGNNGYACYEAAMGMLSRVQLYMEKWDECIATVTEVLGGADPLSKLDPDYENLFQNSKVSPEVLWCVAMIPSDWTDKKGSMGSMFYSVDTETGLAAAPGATGWGEIYYSQPLMDLFQRYPQDKRFLTMAEPYAEDPEKKMVYWPYKSSETDFRLMMIDTNPTLNADGEPIKCKDEDGKVLNIEKRIVNTYPEYHINYDGEDVKVGFSNQYHQNHTIPAMYMKKFANMDGGYNVLNSPIIIRWAEVVLNRAEAYAHKGDDANALMDVKAIRDRAGLTGDAEMTVANMGERGYSNILDLVLDERRMELCFEGHRPMDMFRNNKDLDRRYGGSQPWEVVKYDDKRIPYQIPYGEVSVSGIPQNQR